jgi:hypothetical protein
MNPHPDVRRDKTAKRMFASYGVERRRASDDNEQKDDQPKEGKAAEEENHADLFYLFCAETGEA